jgi:tyrosinase
MFAKPSSDPLSHFGMAGIHGLPYVQWEGAGGTRPVQGAGWRGYCTHGSYIFPTWHRPYVALYEVGGILRGVAYTTILIGFYSK